MEGNERLYQPNNVIIEEDSVSGIPLSNDLTVVQFEAALMALDFYPAIRYPCTKKTLNFGPKKTVGNNQNNLTHHYATMKRI